MESSAEEPGHGFDSTPEGASKDWGTKRTREHGGNKSLASSYIKVTLFGLGAHLISVAYWVLSSLTTSYNADLGSYSLAALYVSHIGSLFLTPSLVNILGAKACAVLSGLCAFTFASSYLYPSWYTIMPSSVVHGFASALLFTTLGVTKNDEVRKVAEEREVDEVTYHGRFSAIATVTASSAAVVAGIITVASLFAHQDTQDYQQTNATNMSESGFVPYNSTSYLIPRACANLSSTTSAASANTVNYYVLVSLCTLATILSVVIFFIARGAAYHQCKVCSFGMKSLLRDVATYAARVLKQSTTPAYGMTLPLWLLMGLVTAYFFGVFTKVRSYCSFISCHNVLPNPLFYSRDCLLVFPFSVFTLMVCSHTSQNVLESSLWVCLSLSGDCPRLLEALLAGY